MNNSQLSIVSATLELGFPLLLALISARIPKVRKWAIVVFAATLPFIIFYFVVSLEYLFLTQRESKDLFTFYAMWEMSFFAYFVCVFVGGLLGFSARPINRYLRGLLGLTAPLLVYALISLGPYALISLGL